MICSKCQRDLPSTDFFVSTKYWCKECRARAFKERCMAHPEKQRQRSKRYIDTHKEQENSRKRAWQVAHPQQTKATQTLRNAVMRGKVPKPIRCEQCQAKGKIHGHHADCSKPLEVRWLCVKCHERTHHEAT